MKIKETDKLSTLSLYFLVSSQFQMSKISGDDGSLSSGNTGEEVHQLLLKNNFPPASVSNTNSSSSQQPQPQPQPQPPVKRKRNLPGTPDPNAEVIALSPTTLMATNRFVCEICNKGFQRDQNLQLHRRGHNLPWKLRQRTTTEVKKRVYICPEPTCVHHNPARALGDLTGIKKHFSRKHGEKKWKCDKCSKKYAVQSDWKAHQKTCGTKEYKCDCGTIFSRRDSFITHRAFCDAIAEENIKVNQGLMNNAGSNLQNQMPDLLMSSMPMCNDNTFMGISDFNNFDSKSTPLKSLSQELVPMPFRSMNIGGGMFSSSSGTLFGTTRSISSASSSLQLSSNGSSGFNYLQDTKKGCQIAESPHMSATALLQKAAQMGATASNSINSPMMQTSFASSMAGPYQAIRPPTFGGIQQQNISNYDQFPSQTDQSSMVGISEGFSNQLMQKSPNEFAQLFQGSSAMNEMGMLTNMLISGVDRNQGLMKNVEHEGSGSSYNLLQRRKPTGPSIYGASSGGGNMTTLDFMGIGGSRPTNLHEQQHLQQRLELEAISQQRLPMMNPFQQQYSDGDSTIEKPIWDV
ncbi:zinc finger protein GAI-ASSOCIATED FACTOR 1-like [Gossypium arboreum]|uniref:zinc finger protein GAI-ASSOCIATED FACTOR 1-like n=1 Tax=Gossypium arboreum TaxID=29729 RepID=UPI00081927D5|nr:zinc finger protein GAI-ASSOCIATED FACTOR 1-like [Gossypium arboreum]